MELFYYVVFGVLAVLVAGLVLSQGTGSGVAPTSGPLVAQFRKLRFSYVLVYSLMMAGDWLQGPYVYRLYEYYGYTSKDIGRLFIAGFGSSMIFGTIVGSLGDKYGRKTAALTYVVTYAGSCLTKHSRDYAVLMFGRLLGGIATSLLFSAFESWLVAEHFKRGLEEQWIGDIFSKAVFAGNGLVAIAAGFIANFLVENMGLGPVAPFDAAFVFLIIGGVIVYFSWPENYGDSQNRTTLKEQFSLAMQAISSDPSVALLGAMQSLFEASMYTFVFLWTPALSPHNEKIYHGFIFACFMTACMGGSSLASILMNNFKVEKYMKYVFGLSALTFTVPFFCHLFASDKGSGEGITTAGEIQLVFFCVFEVLVGIFWPSMMTMRAHYVPEDLRSTILNFFRIPLNLFVCVILSNVHLVPLSGMFGLCAAFMFIAAACQIRLEKIAGAAAKGGSRANVGYDELPTKDTY